MISEFYELRLYKLLDEWENRILKWEVLNENPNQDYYLRLHRSYQIQVLKDCLHDLKSTIGRG